MDKKIFIPEKYGMETCPRCNSHGYIQNPKRHPCPNCGGFGFTKKETGRFSKKKIFGVGALNDRIVE